MSEQVKRPGHGSRWISTKEDFELCYLRHRYVRKASENPTEEEMKPYLPIIKNLSYSTFEVYRHVFFVIGMGLADIVSIGKVHLVSFLGSFAVEKDPKKMAKFIERHQKKYLEKPAEEGVLDKNKADFTTFLKQRMQELVRISKQKSKNIKGSLADEYSYFIGTEEPPKDLTELAKNYGEYGYKKVTQDVFRNLRKKARTTDQVFAYDSQWYVSVKNEQKPLSFTDFIGAGLDPRDNIYNMTPEQIYFAKEEDLRWSDAQIRFDMCTDQQKASIVKNFISNNQDVESLNDEMKAARRLLKSLGTESQ